MAEYVNILADMHEGVLPPRLITNTTWRFWCGTRNESSQVSFPVSGHLDQSVVTSSVSEHADQSAVTFSVS